MRQKKEKSIPIRIGQGLYNHLTKVGKKGESFSDIIERLIDETHGKEKK